MGLAHAMRILGISAYYHDSAAALVVDGNLLAAAQEERFTRIKHDAAFPTQAIDYCLDQAGIRIEDLDYVVFYEKPFLKFERLLETYLSFAPVGLRSFLKAMPQWLKIKLHLPRQIRKALQGRYNKAIAFVGHHQSHAASAFFPSPFEDAAIHHRRSWRMGLRHDRHRRRSTHQNAPTHALPPLLGIALQRLYLLLRVQGEFR